uniref:SH3 and multiple ankyrin repeat domains protein 3-like n=1 Tax=Haemonchus contortus TaxID=6289 RepID=A0A912M3P2_HAECO
MDMDGDEETINIQIYVPEIQVRKCLTVSLDDFVWDVKRKLLATLPQALPQAFNYGLFLPPCDGRAGKFLLEDRVVRDYPFHDCVPYLELKYKKRVYKMLNLDEKHLKSMHSKATLKKFMDYVQSKNAEKVEKLCAQGLDANFHDAQGETPLTLAAGVPSNRAVLVALVGGGAHIDFRNSEGQTAMHKAAFLSSCENVKALLELGASPNYRDPIGLTPLYYNMLTTDSNDQVAEMLLKEASDLGVTDMHGNHEIHQACKNGLAKHIEHLLFYGAVVDAENVNGNTPLHVCSVNNRPDCARVLLFRGANHLAVNKQGQTALHVAHIVGTTAVAEVIASHNPSASVPYRGTPQYSTRRRLTSSLSKRRSLSQSSIYSQDIYGTPQSQRSKPPQPAPSPTPSRISRSTVTPSEYGTMRRFTPAMAPGHEANVPRILVIPRGPKGFGFILRGAKHVASPMDFEPSPLSPALQFFEGVDMSGMAMRAGLRPGDYLLEIDGIDVRCASHEQVVHLIQQAGVTITLKVITVDPSSLSMTATATVSRPRSVGSGSYMAPPPPPPVRHPSTSLSLRGSQSLYGFTGGNEEYYSPAQLRSNYGETHCASVKQRHGGGRRISAAELESLMIRQGERHTYQPIPYDQESISSQTPKKYNSVSDMKRRKQRTAPSPQGLQRSYDYQNNQPMNSIYGSPMKTYSSSPDIPHMNSFELAEDETSSTTSQSDDRLGPYRPAFRPKTPPPPPPPPPPQASIPQNSSPQRLPSSPYSSSYVKQNSPSGSTTMHIVLPPTHESDHTPSPPPLPQSSPPSSTSSNIVPPPPPPPPPNLLKMQTSSTSSTSSTGVTKAGISVEALRSVSLKKAEPEEKKPSIQVGLSTNGSADFQADLRNALAKRRSKVALEQDEEEKSDVDGRFGGLSLRETVRENVPTKDVKQHSPPGIANKKDSGYTSSRTSLEPSEYGEERSEVNASRPHFTVDTSTSRHNVTIISQNIEDNYGARKNIDNMSVSSTLSTLSGCSSESRSTTLIPVVPPIDYDDPDSGTGGSDSDMQNAEGGSFERKILLKWTCADAIQWLISLGLDEYMSAFQARRVDGRALTNCDRTAFTQLGVTRIAHRQKMEASLRRYMGNM